MEDQAVEQSLEDQIASKFMPDEPDETEQLDVAEEVEADDESVGDELEAQEDQDETPESVTIELDGVEYEVPQAIEQAVMKSRDYTQKTQALSETRQKLDLHDKQQIQAQMQQQFMQSVSEESSQLATLEYQINQYKNLDWSQLSVDEMQMARVQLDNLKDQHSELRDQILGKQNEWSQKYQAQQAEYIRQGEEFLKKAIKGYSEDVKRSILEYGIGEGYTESEITASLDPRYIHTLWKAQQYDLLKAQKGKAVKVAPQPQVKATATKKMSQKTKDDLAFRKQMASAKKKGATSSETARLIQKRLESKFG